MRSFKIKDDKQSSTTLPSLRDTFPCTGAAKKNNFKPCIGAAEKNNFEPCTGAAKKNSPKQRCYALRKYAMIVLCLLATVCMSVGFSKWNIHYQQTLTVGGNDAPLLGYVTENAASPENAILNRYLTVEHSTVDASGSETTQTTKVEDIGKTSFTYNGKPFSVNVSDLTATDVAATWTDWGITFAPTYYTKTGTTDYSPTSDSGKTAPANAGTYICVVTAQSKSTPSVNNSTAISNLNFLTNPATNAKKSCAAVVEFTVAPQQITAPSAVDTTYTYTTGSEQEFKLSNFDSAKMTASGNKQTNAGNYTVTVSLNDTTNYVWNGIPTTDTNNKDKNGSATALTFAWTIQKAPIAKPTLTQSEFEYNASNQSVSLTGFDENIMAYGDGSTLTAKDAGNYNVIVKLSNTNYKWSGETEEDKADSPITLTWKITKKTLTKPQATKTEYDYTGKLITLSLDGNFDDTFMSISGNKQTNAGTYSAKIEIKEKNNCVWADGSTDDIIIEWTITQKATLTPTFTCTAFTTSDVCMEGDVITVTVTVKDKDGNAADLGTLALADTSTKNTLTKQDTGTYALAVYVLYNNGEPNGSNTNVVFAPQIGLKFTSTDTNYCDAEYTAEPGSVTVKPVAYNKSTTKYYGTLNKALDSAASGNNVYLIPGSFITVTETLTVTSGVTLYVPYDGETYINTDTLTLHGGDPIDKNATNVETYRKSQILLTSDADLIISSGAKVYLGAITGTKGVYSYYTEITLDTTSHIQVDGSFYCYGYVKELNPVISNTENGDYQNANDSERYIEVSSSGFLEATMALYYLPVSSDSDNNPGSHGGVLQPLNEKNVCPVNVFDFPTLQTYTKLVSGAQMDARVHMYATTSIANKAVDQAIAVVRQNTDKTALFYVGSGYLAFEYNTENNYTSISKKTNVFLGGDITIGSLTIDLSVLTIDTNNYVLPFSYKLCVYVLTDSTFTINKKIKLMPGAFMQINEGGTAVVSSEVAVHTSSNASYMAFYPSGYSDATFINNGRLTLTSTGKFGGLLSTTQTTQNAICDFFAITSKDSFTVTVYEGNEQTPVSYTAKGEFYDASTNQSVMAYFVAASTVTSYGDGSRWQGEMNSTSTLTITKTNSNLVCDYEVYLADDQNGTNAALVASDDGKTYLVTNNKWFKVTTYYCTNAEFTLAANGETFESDTWYQVLGDYKLALTGSEAVNLYLSSYSKSGASSVVYKVYSSPTQDGTYRLMATHTWGGTTSLAKNSWYYVETTNTSFKNGTFNAPTGMDDTSFTCGTKYQITEYTSIELGTSSGSGCLAEGTLITLADGTKKKVENVTANDTSLIFNHETGKYDFAKVLFNDSEALADYTVINLKFSKGKTVKVVSEHGFFDLTLNKYVYVDEYNYNDYVGHKFYSATYNGITYSNTVVTLTSAYLTTERTRVYSPVTKYHLNYFTEDILSMPGGIEGLFNIFEYGENLKYDEALKQADLELYGELTYADFKDLVSLEMYESYPANYFAVAIGKGILSWDKINYYIERYGPLTESANDDNSGNTSNSGYVSSGNNSNSSGNTSNSGNTSSSDNISNSGYVSNGNINGGGNTNSGDNISNSGYVNSGGAEDNSSVPAAQEAAIIPSSPSSKTKSSSSSPTPDDDT